MSILFKTTWKSQNQKPEVEVYCEDKFKSRTFPVMHMSCKGSHRRPSPRCISRPVSLTCSLLNDCWRASRMLVWTSIAFDFCWINAFEYRSTATPPPPATPHFNCTLTLWLLQTVTLWALVAPETLPCPTAKGSSPSDSVRQWLAPCLETCCVCHILLRVVPLEKLTKRSVYMDRIGARVK